MDVQQHICYQGAMNRLAKANSAKNGKIQVEWELFTRTRWSETSLSLSVHIRETFTDIERRLSVHVQISDSASKISSLNMVKQITALTFLNTFLYFPFISYVHDYTIFPSFCSVQNRVCIRT